MKTINFKEFGLYTDIRHSNIIITDVREALANIFYMNVGGIRAHSLSLKIYESTGIVEFNEDEIQLINDVANKFCLPNFIDSLNNVLNNQNTK